MPQLPSSLQSPYAPYVNTVMPVRPTTGVSGLSKVLANPLFGLATGGLFGWLQQRSANKANERAMRQQMDMSNRQLALEQERLANERADMLAAREEDAKRWQADEAYRQSVLARDNEQAGYDRTISEQRQNRLRTFDPYRQMALQRLGRYLR